MLKISPVALFVSAIFMAVWKLTNAFAMYGIDSRLAISTKKSRRVFTRKIAIATQFFMYIYLMSKVVLRNEFYVSSISTITI